MSTSKTSKKFIFSSFFLAWLRKHKLLTFSAIVLVIVAGLVAGYKIVQYQQKFSKEDYDRLTSMAEIVLKNSGGKDIQTSKTCSYERPSEYASLHLYCTVELASYQSYNDNNHAISVANELEYQMSNVFGKVDFSFSRIYSAPYDSSDTASVYTSSSFPHKEQCNFYIHTNRYAMNAASFLPKKTSNDLIALSFECSAESRAEYFPVTYRQG